MHKKIGIFFTKSMPIFVPKYIYFCQRYRELGFALKKKTRPMYGQAFGILFSRGLLTGEHIAAYSESIFVNKVVGIGIYTFRLAVFVVI